MSGYTGSILWVDLSTDTIKEEKVSAKVYKKVLGGVGLGAYFLYNHIPAGADPLGPDNILGFMSGLLTGSGSVMTGRWTAVCKSPLTGGWGDANCGGNLSPAIKRCGYDGIFFKGVSSVPVYLIIDDKGPRLKQAAHLWGKDAIESEEIILAEYADENSNTKSNKTPAAAAVIGPAGENRSLIAGISNDAGRYAARSGVGAVMGSKKLKGLVLAGRKKISCYDPAATKEISKEYTAKIKKQNIPGFVRGRFLPLLGKLLGMKRVFPIDGIIVAGGFKRWGTIFNNTTSIVNGDSPVKNWGGSVVDYHKGYYKHLNPDYIIKREEKKYHCYSCVIGCGGICRVADIIPGTEHTHKPEYETVCSFGPLLMNRNEKSIYIINDLCNRGGIDTISTGSTVAFAIECYENGIISKKDTEGLELCWGNEKAIIALVKKIIAREGLGDLLADGVREASRRLGAGSGEYAVHAGGQEGPMHDPKFDPLFGVHYSVDPTPGRHTIGSGLYYTTAQLWERVSWAPKVVKSYLKEEEYKADEKNALKSAANAYYKQLVDAAGGCLFAMITGAQHWRLFDYFNTVTGWNKTPDEYMEDGRRIYTLRQLFNIKHGIEPKSFKLHRRMIGDPPLIEGPLSGRYVDIDPMIQNHWKQVGWDPSNGVPLPETVKKLALDKL